MPLLYVHLFPNGEDRWYPYKPLLRSHCTHDNEVESGVTNIEKYVSQKQYYTYRLKVRSDTSECLLQGSRLLQQYIIDAFSAMEGSRPLWVRNNQSSLCVEVYHGLVDMV